MKANATDLDEGKDSVIEWAELWLGLPQTMAAQRGRPANFVFFSQLAMFKLYVNVEARKRITACCECCLRRSWKVMCLMCVSTIVAKILTGAHGCPSTSRRPWLSALALEMHGARHGKPASVPPQAAPN